MSRWMRAAVATAILALTALGGATAAQAVSVDDGDLVVEDTAGRLYLPQLEDALDEIDFYAPTTVAIYTYEGEASDEMNERVLAYARETHPEWITDDGQKWADGLFLLALDPEGRQVGTYFGEDRAVSLDDQAAIQDATKDAFRAGDWTGGVIDGVEAAAGIIERPWYASPAVIVTGWVGGGAAVGAWLIALGVRASRREKVAAALTRGGEHLTRVTMDLDTTELAARTLPSDSPYAQRLDQRFHDFWARYHRALEEQRRIEALTKKERSRADAVEAARRFADDTAEMDFVDDAIVHAAALLTKSHTWERAWAAQVDPVREDLAGITALVEDPAAAELATAHALTAFRAEAEAELERLGAGLRAGSLEPGDALAALEALRARLSDLLADHSRALIAAFAQADSEREAMEAELERERQTNRARTGSILDTVSTPGQYWSPVAFSAGYSAGVTQVESDRSAASSSSFSSGGSTTGYGSSGGSFSGSGSSSRF
ncbi:hypothetical protein GCM10017576_10230 [Microbacterium barkeri]|uniref:DUF5129 domain-containing protein n=1 Tax=Microbacterium barkeri TaxID=33917 RepID=A0A9W6LVM4_9MICO|nr:DUF5129 domain-containing protein [Microbacterium barkeri]MDR6877738.1 putative membrane protein YgcG [Microbacterium barkeri]GLJ60894.1 hypothetical protein GCM10017576_10230 [Microbacterium barkeri]